MRVGQALHDDAHRVYIDSFQWFGCMLFYMHMQRAPKGFVVSALLGLVGAPASHRGNQLCTEGSHLSFL